MQEKIFISYSHKDSLTAEHIVTYFSRRNYDVWIDKSKLNLDTDWASSIDEAIFKTDYFLGIISSVSVRRPQVIREINLAFDRKKSNPNYKTIFIVLGKVHRNWFANNSKINCENLIKHLETYQYVSLDSKGTITTAIMKQLEAALIGKQIKRYTKDYIEEKSDNEYVYEGANPILKEDIFEENSISCYRCNPDDLSPSAAYLMALDDVWVPDIILKEKNELHDKFIKEGLFNPDVNKYINDCKQDNFFSTLFHNRQIILNINYLFFCGAINKYLFTTKDVANENKAFDKLLKNGSIVVFLYKKDFVNPYIEYDSDKMKEYGKERTIEWNKKCKEFPVYVLREDWYDTKDNHSIQTIKYFSTFAGDPIILEKFALCFGIKNEAKKNKFIKSIKDSEIFFFNKIHDNPNSTYGRTKFYEDFVVKPRTKEDNTVQGCKLEDTHKKPFRREYKKIADFQYNSLFVNHFKCNMILPLEMSEEDIMLEQIFMYHGDETIDTNEVEYFFSEMFTYVDKLLDITDTFNNYIYINKWNLEKITELRAKDSWEEYISLLETIYTNNNERGIDFDEIELLLNRFARCLNEIKEEDKKPVENKDDLAISFRIIIETDMIEIFISRDKKLIKYTNCKKMPYSSRGNLEIYFSVGDIMTRNKDTIFMPLCMFNGKTKTEPKEYFIELMKFFKSNGFNIAKGK